MSLKLKKNESVDSGLRRIITERLQAALRELDRRGDELDDAVHNARKRLKEARAVLRLLRPALPEELYQTEKASYRDTARPLSQARDAKVLIDALDKLAAESGEAGLGGTLKSELEARRLQHHHALVEGEGVRELQQVLARAALRVPGWPVDAQEWETLRRGLSPVYRRGRHAMRAAQAEPTNENLHEWRKQAKALWYQVQVLENLWPGLLAPLADEIHQLTDLLGDDHDLAVLEELISANGATGLPADAKARLLEHLTGQRRQLQEDAFALGERLYAEGARTFTQRLGEYWALWKQQNAPASA